ncbi:unnamed protein product [Schistosoma mattheei]|uniref:Uncharacterized protein n=1 Tax=Schistosoma mattheei TaxID=31246 RepID=A0A183Q1T6_9TREM|nr:unnamed protein product [Schistosoma mattheei]
MTESRFPTDKRIVYISPKELSSLPTDGPIYVLSTTKNPEHNDVANCSSTELGASSQDSSSITCSTFGSTSTSSTNSANYFNNTLVPYSFPYHANIPYPTPVVSTNLILPYGFCPPFQLPPFVGSQPVSWVTPAFPNHTLYPPSTNLFPASGQYIHPYQNPPTFQQNVPPNSYFQTFNPHKPPPSFSLPQVTSKSSNAVLIHNSATVVTTNNTVTCVASTMNTNNTKHSCSFNRSNGENGFSEPNNSKSESTSSKQSHPLRYTKLIYASELDYFAFDSSVSNFFYSLVRQ